jgi:Ca2+-binding EF-hand superfamily protein
MSSVVFERIYKKYDANNDGKINRQEFQKICYELGHFLSEDELTIAFALVDSDGSGQIEKSEFKTFWQTDDRFKRLRLDDAQATKLAQRTFVSI